MTHRHGLLRSFLKDAAAEAVPKVFKLENLVEEEVAHEIRDLLEDEQFVFPLNIDEVLSILSMLPLTTTVSI